jgi:Zn-finger nucleic acid-binding protein
MPRCPSCFTPLTRVEEDNIRSAVCGNCFGTWINAVALLQRTRLDAAAAQLPQPVNASPATTAPPFPPETPAAASLEDLAQVVHVSNKHPVLRCAQCEKPMTKQRVHPLIPIEVDRCRACNYFWLDAGELPLLRRLYTEMIISTDPDTPSTS